MLIMLILRDKNSVLILCIILVAVFFLARVVRPSSISERCPASTAMAFSLHNHCLCRLLCRVHIRLTTAPPIDASGTSTARLFALETSSVSCLSVILEIFVTINFRIVRKFLEFMKINSLLISIPGLKCTVKRSNLWKLKENCTPKS